MALHRSSTTRGLPLLWRAFLLNGAILLIACVLLLVTPATVSFPVAVGEALVVLCGVVLVLLLTLPAYRRTFTPLTRLADQMRRVDLLEPATRASADGPDHEVNQLARSFNDMLDRLQGERRASAARAAAAQEDERRRVARELHDTVGQLLTGVLLHAERLTGDVPAALRPRVQELSDTTRTALEDVRRIARELRPETLDDLGLPSALNALASAIQRQAHLPVDRALRPDVARLRPEDELLVYRVAQESLTNVVRHAHAGQARITLRDGPDGTVELLVEDDGRGLPAALPAGAGGLRGLRERALAAEATLRLEQSELGGTRVALRVRAEVEAVVA
jgi:two-component system sensor histidine kinase UhpB